ncbi:hypothetical protein [Methanolobus psychrotolerans]|uniref:hypothetical protein n=1 Tax=Methanolobus psychrotolerans TaxID=1874706 RepID=UPI000B917AC2|nr:hypothetical protein [Methanolobus psychrotolerans]
MLIGNVELPAVNVFRPGNVVRPTENIYPLGSMGIVVAEFEPDLPEILISGNILQKYAGTRTVYQLKEDAEALTQRLSGYNYIHNIKGRSGWISVDSVDVDDNTGSLWPVTITGQWFDKGNYVMMLTADQTTHQNDWDITGEYRFVVPIGASWYSPEETVHDNITVEDGTQKSIQPDAVHVYVEMGSAETSTGECRCYDYPSPPQKQVFSTAHIFEGSVVVTNGLYKIILAANVLYVYYLSGGEWTLMTTLNTWVNGTNAVTTLTQDKIIVRRGNDLKITMETARPPHIYCDTAVLIVSPSVDDQTTTTDNYLTLASGVYVASNMEFSITDNYIDAGHMWIFRATSGASDAAHNCLVKGNVLRQVVRR